MKKDTLVIGGGIVGLCTAYYLARNGCAVTIIDDSDSNSSASFVNAGYITPSHIIPLAAPGMPSKALKWMLRSDSPFYMRPRWDTDFFRWAWAFYKSCTPANVQAAIPVIKNINLLSKDLWEEMKISGELGDFQWEKNGLLMLFTTEKSGDSEYKVAAKALEIGLETEILSWEQLHKIEPQVSDKVLGAVHYKCDAHTTPNEFMKNMVTCLENKGVVFKKNEQVNDIFIRQKKVKEIQTNKGAYKADEVVLAAGSWTARLARKLNMNLLLQPGKGYSVNTNTSANIRYPAVLMESKVAVTPMRGFTRFAGTMEFSGYNHFIRKERVLAIAKAAGNYYKDLTIPVSDIENAKCGLRPVTPDGLPYIGKTKIADNLTIAAGHAMMGWSLGPATGKLVSEIVFNRKTSMDIAAFNPMRRF
ncbi:NAD(P)/FAD-dependent oxidoreductase [Ascidiimonas aurantiaca]|uniref:NAD(P)/FAD-dependent oxidoreductase n=1 Tax=Ascidiimonas aurantiaca TaxID=1685432 RepID=UPI0030EC7DF0